MKSVGRMAIPSITLNAKDLEILIETAQNGISKTIKKSLTGSVKLSGNNYQQEFDGLLMPDIDMFHDNLKLIEINIYAPKSLEISITMSAEERNPFSPVISYVFVEAESRILVSGILDEIRRFFKKRRNFNYVFHSWGIPIAIALSFALTFILYFDLRAINVIPEIRKDVLAVFTYPLSFLLKAILRWTFPYFHFKGENRYREYTQYIIGAIVLAVIGNLAYAMVTVGFSTAFSQ